VCSESNSAWPGPARVAQHVDLVKVNRDGAANVDHLGAGQASCFGTEDHHVEVSSTSGQGVAKPDVLVGKCLGICANFSGVFLPLWGHRCFELCGESCDVVVVGTALQHREEGIVDPLVQAFLSPADDHTCSGAVERLVSRGGDHICVFEGVSDLTSSEQTGKMCNVNKKESTYIIANLTESLIIDVSRITGVACHNQLGFALLGPVREVVVIHQVRIWVQTVIDSFPELGHCQILLIICLKAVRSVTALSWRKAHYASAWGYESCVGNKVGRTTRHGLHVYMPLVRVQLEALESSLDAKVFDLVDELVATVAPNTWEAVGVLVDET
jgi:hypothetical protein